MKATIHELYNSPVLVESGLGAGQIGQSEVVYGIINPLYLGEVAHPTIFDLLRYLMNHQYEPIAASYWQFVGRLPTGGYRQDTVLQWALICADGETRDETLESPSSTQMFARAVVYYTPLCPTDTSRDASASSSIATMIHDAKRLPEVFVVGSRDDPVVPLDLWLDLVSKLDLKEENSMLVDGAHHTSFPGRSSDVDQAIEMFLLDTIGD